MLPAPDELKTILESLLPGVHLIVEAPALIVEPKDLMAVCRCLKEGERFGLDYVANLTAVDYPPSPTGGEGRIDVVYHLYSMRHKHGPAVVKVKLPRGNPAVDSVTPLWRGAEFQEREVYDLYGVDFAGHPDLRRILMWEGFKGHPMRKDYVPEDQDALNDSPAQT